FLELLNAAAFHADEMIVMGVAVGELVASEAVAELLLVRDAAFREHLHGPVDGGVADARIHRAHPLEQAIERDVLPAAEEGFDDEPALLGGAQPAAGHVRLQRAPQPVHVRALGRLAYGLLNALVPDWHHEELSPGWVPGQAAEGDWRVPRADS